MYRMEKHYLAVSPGSRVRFLMTFLIVGVPQVRTEKENVNFYLRPFNLILYFEMKC